MMAGSQLSNIGRLDWGWRLWIALAGAALGLIAVVWAIWLAVRLLIPVIVTINQLDEQWRKPTKDFERAVEFFKAEPAQLGENWNTPADLKKDRDDTEKNRKEAKRQGKCEEVKKLEKRSEQIRKWIRSIQQVAQNRTLEGRFDRTLKWLICAALLAAIGIVSFAWASNPPDKQPSATLKNARLVGANLRDANLKDANLENSDLTNADLTGADLSGASITGVRWKNTTCPDGVNSDSVGLTCAGHLR